MSNQEKFGIFAVNLRGKVTRKGVKTFAKLSVVPIAVGFKNQRDEWANEFFDVLCFGDLMGIGANIQTGDRVTVSGRVTLEEWGDNKNKQWKIMADSIQVEGQHQPRQAATPPHREEYDGQPPVFPTDPGGMDDVPF